MSNQNVGTKKDVSFFDALNRLIAGIQSGYPATHTFQVSGRTLTQPEYLAALQGQYALHGNVVEAHTSLKTAVAARIAGLAGAKSAYEAAVAAVKADKGPESPELLAFGIVPKKARTPMTSAQRVVAAAKRAATRRARGIVGKRQRAAITFTGQSGVVVVTPGGNSLTVQQNRPDTEPGAPPHAPSSGSPAQEPSTNSAPASGGQAGSGTAPTATPSHGSAPQPSSSPGSGMGSGTNG